MASTNLARGNPQLPGDVKFLDFAPDVDPATPGALLATGNLYPSQKGFRTYPRLSRLSDAQLPGQCFGAFTAVFPGNNVVLVAGTANQLYLYQGSSWVSQALTLGTLTTGHWSFDQYGGWVIADNGIDPPQRYTGSGVFAALGGSPPVAGIVQASNYSLFLIVPNSNQWYSSLSATLWTPSIATETVTGNLDETPGEITAAHKLRAGIALYKKKALHFSQFQGPPFYWDFQIVSAQAGAPGQDAVANLGDVHYWPGPEDFYSFDGYSLNRVPNNLKDWFFDNLDGEFSYKIAARWDQRRSLIFWHFPDRTAAPAGTLNAWVCLNIRTGKWTSSQGAYVSAVDVPIFSAVQTGALTYAGLATLYPTYAAFNDTIYGDFVSQAVDQSGAIRHSDKRLALYNGSAETAMLTSHDFGDYHNKYQLTQVQPHFAIYPQSGATIRPYSQARGGDARVPGLAKSLSPYGRFDFRNTARMQRLEMIFNSEVEITGLDALVEYAGEN